MLFLLLLQAFLLATLAAEAPAPNAGGDAFAEATSALRNEDFAKLKTILARCEEAQCTYLKGELQLLGLNEARNLTEATRLFMLAADEGYADAQFAVAVLLANAVEGSAQELRRREALSILNLYAASLSSHPGALMAMGYRHAMGYGVPKACSTAALNYIEVAREVAGVYSAGMPQAIELIRLGAPGKDRRFISPSEVHVYAEAAQAGNPGIAAAVGKRYLLGIDGFNQDYQEGAHYLKIAATHHHAEALALLGYMYSLGLGVEKNADQGHVYFQAAAKQNDSSGLNGLGYVFFHGAPKQAPDHRRAFSLFNESAYRGSADGMFNLASVYLTGAGVNQSFQKAVVWYTEALDRGHTPAAYALAVMHLNGIGTTRSCKIAVELLKRVCERGNWVADKLQEAYDQQISSPEKAAWLFLRLAEAGHEVAQANVAHMLDRGGSHLLFESEVPIEQRDRVREREKVHAQRQYEMSAAQGNVLSELRLGDYAYYGWGLRLQERGQGTPSEGARTDDDGAAQGIDATEGSDGLEDEGSGSSLNESVERAERVPQEPNVGMAVSHYRRAASSKVTGEWMEPLVARASFNLGYLHQFGIGMPRDTALAVRHYRYCREVDPTSVHAPVTIMMMIMQLQGFFLDRPPLHILLESFFNDLRAHALVLNLLALVVLLAFRNHVLHQMAAPSSRASARRRASH